MAQTGLKPTQKLHKDKACLLCVEGDPKNMKHYIWWMLSFSKRCDCVMQFCLGMSDSENILFEKKNPRLAKAIPIRVAKMWGKSSLAAFCPLFEFTCNICASCDLLKHICRCMPNFFCSSFSFILFFSSLHLHANKMTKYVSLLYPPQGSHLGS